jgi:cysteine synthase B
LRELNSSIVTASVQPDSPFHGLEGLKHMESAIVPGIYDDTIADHDLRVPTEAAHEMTRRLAKEEGLLVGISSGAALAAAMKWLKTGDRADGATVVVIFPDGGDRYLSEAFWEAK